MLYICVCLRLLIAFNYSRFSFSVRKNLVFLRYIKKARRQLKKYKNQY